MFEHGITVNARGKVRPCCSFESKNANDYYFHETDKWQEQFALLNKKSQNTWLPQCYECKEKEERGSESLRQQSNKLYSNTHGIKYWDLKISNTCNLMCRMCSSGDSSTWQKNVNNNPQFDWYDTILNDKNSWHDTDLPKVKELLYDIDVLKFTGGEPMLVKHVKDVINHVIDIEACYNTTLVLTTNATVPFVGWWEELISKFKHVHITCSIDGIGSRYEYIRAGANWNEVEKNVMHLLKLSKNNSNFSLKADCVLQALNASIMQDIDTWAKSLDLNIGYSVEVTDPPYMSYASLDESLRKRYNVKSRYTFDPKMLQQLKRQMSYIDEIYGTDFKTECPEFFEGDSND